MAGQRVLPLRHAVAWTIAGFAAGAIFWHLVGFWSFIAVAVFNGDDATPSPSAPTVRAMPERTPSVATRTGSICAELVLDRATGDTRQVACPPAKFHLRQGGLATRSDREPVLRPGDGPGVAGWAARLDEVRHDSQVD